MAKKSKKDRKPGSGRKRLIIDWAKVDKYLKAQCNGVSIAGILGIHPETLYNACKREFKLDFSAYSEKKKGQGKELLRAKQYDLAMKGEKTMLIWLGKQYLEQKEKTETNLQAEIKTDQLPDIIINVISKDKPN
jgi:hypothetical protein